jgi:hypothetical protein
MNIFNKLVICNVLVAALSLSGCVVDRGHGHDNDHRDHHEPDRRDNDRHDHDCDDGRHDEHCSHHFH